MIINIKKKTQRENGLAIRVNHLIFSNRQVNIETKRKVSQTLYLSGLKEASNARQCPSSIHRNTKDMFTARILDNDIIS